MWASSGSREQFLYCGLRKFRHSKSSVYRWYTQLDRRRFVYDTWDSGSRLGHVMVECTLSITDCLRLNLQLHTIDLVRTCRISSFSTVAWQLARFQLTRRIARSLGDSWASCKKQPIANPVEQFTSNTNSSFWCRNLLNAFAKSILYVLAGGRPYYSVSKTLC